jgi:hypothetical protein|tara:strand:- start:216 stop:332 length:117 start_codon:yes stop_codon:yes gene_type:complete
LDPAVVVDGEEEVGVGVEVGVVVDLVLVVVEDEEVPLS